MTYREDARMVYFAGALLAAAVSVGFAWLADGFASAVLCQVVLGIGVAATYMPGLRLLSDRVSGPYQSRYIAFYTSFFGIGTALSLAMAGLISVRYGWPAAVFIGAIRPPVAGGPGSALQPNAVPPPRAL